MCYAYLKVFSQESDFICSGYIQGQAFYIKQFSKDIDVSSTSTALHRGPSFGSADGDTMLLFHGTPPGRSCCQKEVAHSRDG